ncbi:MAG: biotin/lipoyl-containing protein, partial [Acutalibacteraceae bacterium]|nr:biotin/lipoyl-containing protein [Acutalibacteraceae bacterium]
MKMYKVNVNGTEYEITLEVVDAADVKPAAPAPAAAPAPVAEAAPAPAAAPAAAGGETVVAPMPGTILSVNVANGAAVKKGDVLLVLEAMKMENEIMAPCDGTVSSVPATKGATVNTGDVL